MIPAVQLAALRARLGDGAWHGLRALDAWADAQGWYVGRLWRVARELSSSGEAETRLEPVDEGGGLVVHERQWRLVSPVAVEVVPAEAPKREATREQPSLFGSR